MTGGRQEFVPLDAHLQHGPVVVQIRDAPEQTPPDANIVQRDAHPSARQRMPHVVGVAQQKHPCKRHQSSHFP